MWFLLGYTARLADRYQLSVDSYNHGLKLEPNSVRGLAGLAQTYAKMGRTQEAEQLLQRVIDANPKDANSLELAGELMLSTDPKAALPLLQRAEALQPTAHGDLLIAHAYERLGQPEDSATLSESRQEPRSARSGSSAGSGRTISRARTVRRGNRDLAGDSDQDNRCIGRTGLYL